MYVHTYSIAFARRERGHTQTHSDTHRHTRRYWGGAVTANPPQSRAPPGGPPAQGATSDQAPLRLPNPIRPLASSGVRGPALRALHPRLASRRCSTAGGAKAAQQRLTGAANSCPGTAPSLLLFQDETRAGVVGPKVPCVPTRCLLVFSRMSGRMHPGVSSCMLLALRCPLSRPTLPRVASAQSLTLARPLSHNERAPISEVTRISLE